jgi:hypothetical protein
MFLTTTTLSSIKKKREIFTVKKYFDENMDLRGIPVLSEYTYPGVIMDDSGSLKPL